MRLLMKCVLSFVLSALCPLLRLDLLLCSPDAADYGTGMAHGLTGRRAYPYHIAHYRFGHILPDLFNSLLPGSAAYLVHHDYGLNKRASMNDMLSKFPNILTIIGRSAFCININKDVLQYTS